MQFDLPLNPDPVRSLTPISILPAQHREAPEARYPVVYLVDLALLISH